MNKDRLPRRRRSVIASMMDSTGIALQDWANRHDQRPIDLTVFREKADTASERLQAQMHIQNLR